MLALELTLKIPVIRWTECYRSRALGLVIYLVKIRKICAARNDIQVWLVIHPDRCNFVYLSLPQMHATSVIDHEIDEATVPNRQIAPGGQIKSLARK